MASCQQTTILPAGQTCTDSMATAACIVSKQHLNSAVNTAFITGNIAIQLTD